MTTPTAPCAGCQDGTAVQPIPVHVTGADVQLQQASSPVIGCRAHTVVLTSTNPVQEILGWDDKRVYALVQAGGNDAVINNSYAEIGNGANVAPGLPNPVGMVLPYGNTVPTKIPGGQRWWAAAAAYPTQVTVLEVQEG
jgi:hypothetical protein